MTIGCPKSGVPKDRSSSLGWGSRFWDLGEYKSTRPQYYSGTRVDVSRNRSIQVDATTRERRPSMRPNRTQLLWFRSKTAATPSPSLAELLALLGRHPLPGFRRYPAGCRAARIGTVAAPASKQNPAQNQHPESLPEADLVPSKQRRSQPVPQMLHHFTANRHQKHDCRRGHKKDPLFHFKFLTSSKTRRECFVVGGEDEALRSACATAAYSRSPRFLLTTP